MDSFPDCRLDGHLSASVLIGPYLLDSDWFIVRETSPDWTSHCESSEEQNESSYRRRWEIFKEFGFLNVFKRPCQQKIMARNIYKNFTRNLTP